MKSIWWKALWGMEVFISIFWWAWENGPSLQFSFFDNLRSLDNILEVMKHYCPYERMWELHQFYLSFGITLTRSTSVLHDCYRSLDKAEGKKTWQLVPLIVHASLIARTLLVILKAQHTSEAADRAEAACVEVKENNHLAEAFWFCSLPTQDARGPEQLS